MRLFRECILFLIVFAMFFPGVVSSAERQWITHLDNGMRVIIIEDHSSPLAASVVNIRAGSHTETSATSGLSHLVEHMLFNGTLNRTGEQLKSEVPALGGYINAYARKDYAAYEIVMPSEHFIHGLEIQADQLLNSIMPESELEREQKVVCEEIAQDAKSAGAAAENAVMEVLFGRTGYGLPIIGNCMTVTNATREQAMGFYRSRYVPNRMTAVIVGSVDPQRVLETIRELYEKIPAGLEFPGPGQAPDFPAEGVHTVLKRDVNGDAVTILLPAPEISDPSWFAFQIAVDMWANTTDGPLQEKMKPLTHSAMAYVTPHNGFSLVTVSIRPLENDDSVPVERRLKKIETALLESIEMFMVSGATEQAVARRIRSARVDHEFSRERANHLARDIGALAALNALDNFWYFNEKIQSVSAEQVNHVFAGWFSDVRPVSVWVQADSGIAGADDNVSGTHQPAIKTLDNGLTVISYFDPYADLVAINLLIRNSMPEYPGIPRIVAEMLNAGTRNLTREDLESALTDRGIRTKLADWPWLPFDDYYDSIEYNYLQMECLSEDFDTAMDLFGQMVFDSILPDEAWETTAGYMRMLAGNAERSASGQSGRLLSRVMFTSEFHQQSRLPLSRDIQEITAETLRAYYGTAYQPSEAIVSVVGNIEPERVFEFAGKHFGKYASESAGTPPEVTLNMPRRGFIGIDDPVASVRAALPLEVTPDTLPVWSVIATILSDQLQDEIRYRRGRAYRLGAGLNEMHGVTYLAIGIGTQGENLAEVEQAAREIVDGISGMTFDAETVFAAVNSLRGREWRYRQRRINRAYFMAWRHWLGYGIDYERSWTDRIGNVMVEAVNEAMTLLKPADAWFWAVAGQETADKEPEDFQAGMGAGHGY